MEGMERKYYNGKSPKQGLASTYDLTMEFPEEHESPCNRSD